MNNSNECDEDTSMNPIFGEIKQVSVTPISENIIE